jgi:hypothetical protein
MRTAAWLDLNIGFLKRVIPGQIDEVPLQSARITVGFDPTAATLMEIEEELVRQVRVKFAPMYHSFVEQHSKIP